MSLIFSSNIALKYVKKRNVLVQLSKKACQKMWTHFFSKLVKNEGQTVLTANDFSDVWGSDSSCQQLASLAEHTLCRIFLRGESYELDLCSGLHCLHHHRYPPRQEVVQLDKKTKDSSLPMYVSSAAQYDDQRPSPYSSKFLEIR